ncbi:MAG: M23 family metallopeptidase [Bacillota bacterium]|nr:M23 family metallopeptidase [Bacillota bacterium]
MNKKLVIFIVILFAAILTAAAIFLSGNKKTAQSEQPAQSAQPSSGETKDQAEETLSNLTISDNIAYPGDFVSFSFTGSKDAVASITINGEEQKIPTYNYNNKMIGVFVLPLDAEPTTTIRVSVSADKQNPLSAELEVGKKDFENIDIPPVNIISLAGKDKTTIDGIVKSTADVPLSAGLFAIPASGKQLVTFGQQLISGGKEAGRVQSMLLQTESGEGVTAANAGKVVFAGKLPGEGNTVIIDHGVGIFTIYGLLNNISVKAGDKVSKYDQLGTAGKEPLQYAAVINGVYSDPMLLNVKALF